MLNLKQILDNILIVKSYSINNKEIMKSEKLTSSKWNNINHFNVIIRKFQRKREVGEWRVPGIILLRRGRDGEEEWRLLCIEFNKKSGKHSIHEKEAYKKKE